VRTVLVCVRSPLAAQNVASAAARLGLGAVVRTAVSDSEVMLRLAERPADVVLADTALTRPDSAAFTRRVLARSPGAALLLFGSEEPAVAAAAVAAGARGLIHGGDYDLVSAVAKALLLLSVPGRQARGPARPGPRGGQAEAAGAEPARLPARPGTVAPVGAGGGGWTPDGAPAHGGPLAADEPTGPAMVPVQRGDDFGPAGDPDDPRGTDETLGGPSGARPNAAPDARFAGHRRGDGGNDTGYGRTPAGPTRRVSLTEREMQVLVGMADGKSNAEIGRDLFVSEDTVKTHARRLFRKLGARDRAHAVAAGFRAGLVA
jgi:DNA-binding NarL/FixJ family response regulator